MRITAKISSSSCAAVYRGDSRHLVRAGLEGGKGVDESIALHPAFVWTLTAPASGAYPQQPGPPSPCRDCCDGLIYSAKLPPTVDVLLLPPAGRRVHRHSPLPRLLRLRGRGAPQRVHAAAARRCTTIYTQRQLAVVLGRTQADTDRAVRLSFAGWPSSSAVASCICTPSTGRRPCPLDPTSRRRRARPLPPPRGQSRRRWRIRRGP